MKDKKFIKIQLRDKYIQNIELDLNSNLNTARDSLEKSIDFNFSFLNDDNQEISKEDELSMTLDDILDGKKLHIKKQKKYREILGKKIDTKNGIDYYLYPKCDLTDEQKKISTNIMTIGETGVGKSTWIHSLLNYLEEIEIDENIRYLLFDEKQQQKEYESKYGEKSSGSSVTDKPEIYELYPTKLYNNPIRIIDTSGFGDTRGIGYDNKIIEDIRNLFENSNIDNITAICLFFKASDTRAHDRFNYILEKIFSIFGEDIKCNFVVLFNFADSYTDLPIMNVLKDTNTLFYKIFGDIENLPTFCFNNRAYFSSNKDNVYNFYENNNNNFKQFFEYLSKLESKSLDNTKKVLKYRKGISEKITIISENLNYIQKKVNKMEVINQDIYKKDLLKFDSWPHHKYCNKHNKICHNNCKGIMLQYSNVIYFFYYCQNCNCRKTEYNIVLKYKDIKTKLYENYRLLFVFHKIYFKLLFMDKTLNNISLLKTKAKNEYIYKILKEIVKEKNKIADIFSDNYNNIDNLTNDLNYEIVHTFIK